MFSELIFLEGVERRSETPSVGKHKTLVAVGGFITRKKGADS